MSYQTEKNKKSPLSYRIIYRLVRLFSPKYRIEGEEELPPGACVIAGNHCHMYGPIAAEIYTPGVHSTWCAGEMMHRDEVAAYAYKDFWSEKPKAVRWFYKLLSRLIVPVSVLVFNNARTIPVYHDSRLLITFKKTVAALGAGERVVIFPECYDRHNNIVYSFRDRFVDIARLYDKKTGQPLLFVPMYIAPKMKLIRYGKPIAFDPDAPIEAERERICGALMDGVTALAAALPKHTVVPYPNMPKRKYPKSLPVEVYDNEKDPL